jgi:hypothetical protein
MKTHQPIAAPGSILAAALLIGAAPVQAIVGGISTSSFMQVASGVQITDNWVLTASHLNYAVGSTFTDGYGSATVAATYVVGPGPFPADDLTLLRLAAPIAAPQLQVLSNVVPAGTFATPVPVTIATGQNQTPRGYAFADLREVRTSTNTVSGPVAVNWLVTYSATLGAPYVEGGDSGGGLFLGQVTDSNGGALMGITSAQLQGGVGQYGSAFIQLAAYRSWIDTTMTGDLTDSQLPQWVSAVPEPASWALLLAGGALLGAVSLRQRRELAAPR